MRLPLLLPLLLSCLSLTAQRDGTDHRWAISFTFAPELRGWDPEPILLSETDSASTQSPLASLVQIEVDGQSRLFERAVADEPIRITQDGFGFGMSLRAHRELRAGFEVDLGLQFNYADFDRSVRRQDNDVRDITYLINTNNSVIYAGGVVSRLLYYPLRQNRFRPYVGFGASGQLRHETARNSFQTIIGPAELLVQEREIAERFRSSTIYAFDFLAVAGLAYRVGERWNVGLEVSSRYGPGQGLVGVQGKRYF